jgi:hypothetical protein
MKFSHVEVIYFFHEVAAAKTVSGARHPRNNPDWPAAILVAKGLTAQTLRRTLP